MNYEKRYNELIEAIKEMLEANPHDEGLQNWAHDNVPELAESEDERIRKALIRFHKSTIDIDGIKGDEIVSWLEKQGIKPQDDDKQIMKEIAEFIYNSTFKPKDIKKKEKWLTWFEKQGEKPQGKTALEAINEETE